MARLLLLIAVVCFASSRAAEVSVYERAKVWLKSHQIPQESDLDVLKQEDPKTFSAVRQLLNRQVLGTLDQHPVHAPAKLSKEAMAQFKYSKATEDRRSVLALEAKMFADKQNWAKMQESKQTKLSKLLTGEEKPKPKPAAVPKTAFRKPAPAQEPAVYVPELDVLPAAPRRRLSNLATHTTESWGDLKKFAHATKKAAVAGKKYQAPEPRRPSQGWGTLMKNWQTRKQEQFTGKGSALAGFSWGNDEAAAEPEEHKTLSTLSSSQVRLPAMEMPDQLKDWMTAGKKKSQEQQTQDQQVATQQDGGNSYSMDLN